MKRIVLALVFLATLSSGLVAQNFEKGSNAINAGIGFGYMYYRGSYYDFRMPSITATYERGIVEVPMGSELKGIVSVGGIFGIGGTKYKFGDNEKFTYTYLLFAVRGNYHFIFMDKLDPYAGISLGYVATIYNYKGDDPFMDDFDYDAGKFAPGVYVGARYFFTENIAVFAELGYQLTLFNFGATFKF